MENPNTWTPLHHALHVVHMEKYYPSYDEKVESLRTTLQEHGIECSWDDVNCVLTEFNYNCLSHFCGKSFPAMLVDKLKK